MILFADKESLDQSPQMRRLIWAFAVRICKKTRLAWRGPYNPAYKLESPLGVNVLNILRKNTYSNIQKISPPKPEKFQIKNSDIFHISAQNIDCGYSLEPPRRGGSNDTTIYVFEQK